MDEDRKKWFFLIDSKIMDYNRAISKLLEKRDSRTAYVEWLKNKKANT